MHCAYFGDLDTLNFFNSWIAANEADGWLGQAAGTGSRPASGPTKSRPIQTPLRRATNPFNNQLRVKSRSERLVSRCLSGLNILRTKRPFAQNSSAASA